MRLLTQQARPPRVRTDEQQTSRFTEQRHARAEAGRQQRRARGLAQARDPATTTQSAGEPTHHPNQGGPRGGRGRGQAPKTKEETLEDCLRALETY